MPSRRAVLSLAAGGTDESTVSTAGQTATRRTDG